MNNNDLNLTRKKIAIIFTLLVFFIALLLEIVFLSIKYYNINYVHKKDFKEITNNFYLKEQNLNEKIKNKYIIRGGNIRVFDFSDYLEELISFLLINMFFSIIFYYLGLYFAGKNLKPIENTLNDMTYFIHNANHELKTPISVISSNLQIMKATKTYEQDLIDNSIDEIKRIDNLIIGLSKLSDINSITTVENLDLNKEVKNILEEFKQNISEKNIKLNYEFIKNTKLKVNKDYFYIMFSNLLRNAIKYNIYNGEIDVILDKNKLIISNTGSGISNEDLPKIFDRFYKGEKSRNTEGFGIGLSLVKKICDIYNWEIVVKSDINKKTIFKINF